jgi:hypothetical protein
MFIVERLFAKGTRKGGFEVYEGLLFLEAFHLPIL